MVRTPLREVIKINLGATFVELANILFCASWGNQGILNEQLPSLHSAFSVDLSPLIRQDFVHQFWRMDSISPRSQCTFKDY